jgi:hypothetical protein
MTSGSNLRRVYYSLANSPDGICERQWVQSIRSLRRHNSATSVSLFLFNGASEDLLHEAARCGVTIRALGDYREYLERFHVRGSVLSLYRTFHKFLLFSDPVFGDATQVLFLDCDTFFFSDVDLLFDGYPNCDWYARVEPRSVLSHLPYDPSYLDEQALATLALRERGRPIVPFNTGVCLLNNDVWRRFELVRFDYLDLAWRLLSGQALSPDKYSEADPEVLAAALNAMNEADRSRGLPYPSSNAWIVDEIALWLALGRMSELSQGLISRDDVVQGAEFQNVRGPEPKCILAHYYTRFQTHFFSRVHAISE